MRVFYVYFHKNYFNLAFFFPFIVELTDFLIKRKPFKIYQANLFFFLKILKIETVKTVFMCVLRELLYIFLQYVF